MGRSIIIWLLFLLVEGGLIVSFAEPRSLEELMRNEFQSASTWLGQQKGREVYRQSEQIFRSAFVDSGVVRFSYQTFSVNPNNPTNHEPGMDKAKGVVDFMDARVDAFWALLLMSIQRLVTGMSWAPYLLVLLVPAAIDGWVQREIKKHNFGYTSPVRHQLALFGLVGLIFLPLVLAAAPIHIGPLMAPIWAIAASTGVAVLAANTQKTI